MRFTTENAAEYGRRGAAISNQRHKQPEAPTSTIAVPSPPPEDGFAEKTLARVRKQMDLLATEIDSEISGESKRLKELTDSYARLAEQERILAGRPMPGSRRPVQDRPSRHKRSLDPVELAPQPQPVAPSSYNPADPAAPNG